MQQISSYNLLLIRSVATMLVDWENASIFDLVD